MNESPPEIMTIDDQRFLFITGKGGVGKTTVTAALAMGLAERGKRVLVTSCDGQAQLGQSLAMDPESGKPLDDTVRELRPGVWGVRLVPDACLREYGLMKLKSRVLNDAVFGNRYAKNFFAAVPGLRQWAMLGKAWFHSTEKTGKINRFDVVLFDAPATGHALEMLQVPKVIVDSVPAGILRTDAQAAWEMLCDPVQAGVLLVTLPEEMPTNETVELQRAITGELGLPCCGLVINQVIPKLFSSADASALTGLSGDSLGPLELARRRARREQVQGMCIDRLLATVDRDARELPFISSALDTGALSRLKAALLS